MILIILISLILFLSCEEGQNKIYGCTDKLACNFNPKANIYDNSCFYLNELCWGCENIVEFGEQPPMHLTGIDGHQMGFQGNHEYNIPICTSDLLINKVTSSGTDDLIEEVTLPIGLEITNAWPNPFDGEIQFNVSVPEQMLINISIYNLSNEAISTIVNDNLTGGYYMFSWDGLDSTGNEAENCYYKLYLNESCFVFIKKTG